jgi:hypothetical protein
MPQARTAISISYSVGIAKLFRHVRNEHIPNTVWLGRCCADGISHSLFDHAGGAVSAQWIISAGTFG